MDDAQGDFLALWSRNFETLWRFATPTCWRGNVAGRLPVNRKGMDGVYRAGYPTVNGICLNPNLCAQCIPR